MKSIISYIAPWFWWWALPKTLPTRKSDMAAGGLRPCHNKPGSSLISRHNIYCWCLLLALLFSCQHFLMTSSSSLAFLSGCPFSWISICSNKKPTLPAPITSEFTRVPDPGFFTFDGSGYNIPLHGFNWYSNFWSLLLIFRNQILGAERSLFSLLPAHVKTHVFLIHIVTQNSRCWFAYLSLIVSLVFWKITANHQNFSI